MFLFTVKNLSLFVWLFPLVLRAGIVFDAPLVVVPCEAGQTEVKAELPFKAEGAVSVTGIKTGCDCTSGAADAGSYAPGARGKINLVFTVGERTGFQRKTISVTTSDGKEAVAFFQTTVPMILQVTPAFVFWRQGDPATTKQVEVKVVLAGQGVSLLGATVTPADAFAVEFELVKKAEGPAAKKADDKKSAERSYVVKITPKKTDAPVTARIVLKTEFPADEVERFVVVAAVKK
jgi:hypothetical protein